MPSDYTDVKIVCLAKSKKLSKHCLAGKIIEGPHKGKWIRPVSSSGTGELSNGDIGFKGGGQPKLCDLITVPLKSISPHAYQNENYLIDSKEYCSKIGETDFNGLAAFVDKIRGPLWECGNSSTEGINDRVHEHRATAAVQNFGNSLCLIEVDNLQVSVRIEGADFNNPRKRIRGRFDYQGHRYFLGMTDPVIIDEYFSEIGEYEIGKSLLCISLGVAHASYAYKLIAAVFRP